MSEERLYMHEKENRWWGFFFVCFYSEGRGGGWGSNVNYSSETQPRPSEERKHWSWKWTGKKMGNSQGENCGVKETFPVTTHDVSERHKSQYASKLVVNLFILYVKNSYSRCAIASLSLNIWQTALESQAQMIIVVRIQAVDTLIGIDKPHQTMPRFTTKGEQIFK